MNVDFQHNPIDIIATEHSQRILEYSKECRLKNTEHGKAAVSFEIFDLSPQPGDLTERGHKELPPGGWCSRGPNNSPCSSRCGGCGINFHNAVELLCAPFSGSPPANSGFDDIQTLLYLGKAMRFVSRYSSRLFWISSSNLFACCSGMAGARGAVTQPRNI